MRYFVIFLVSFVMLTGVLHARGKKRKYRDGPKSEVELMNGVLNCLRHKDTLGYFYLFPPVDSLWQRVIHNSNNSAEAQKQLSQLKEHPQILIDFDPKYNFSIMNHFCHVLAKGEDSGMHWDGSVLQRYELQQDGTPPALRGYELIAPERFTGFMFVKDMSSRTTFCITITEIQKIDGFFFGGQVLNILEASNVDQYIFKEKREKKYLEWLAAHPVSDSANTESARADSLKKVAESTDPNSIDSNAAKSKELDSGSDEDEKSNAKKQIVDRKYYEGKFDDEIPVKLYVRYMKEVGTGKIVAYDGLYKFGDQQHYVKLEITRTADGKWNMEDDPPVGSMELVLKDKTYTGSWLNNESQTGYDALLKEVGLPAKKIEELDNILDKGLSGSAGEESAPEKDAPDPNKASNKKKADDRGNDNN